MVFFNFRQQVTFQAKLLGNFLFFAVIFFNGVFAHSKDYSRNYEPNPGYLSSVENEKSDEGIEIPFAEKPAPLEKPIRDRLFTSELSKEFRDRYEDQFGRTQPERVYNSPNKATYYDDLYTFNGTPAQVDDHQRAFGNYMAARLVEYHTDNYLKSDPSMRTIYETKERLSQVKVELDEVKFDAKYSLAGNLIDLRARAPWFDTKITLGSSQRILSFTRAQSASLGLEARYLDIDKKLAWIMTKRLTRFFSTSLTASACTGDSTASYRETLYLGGMSYGF